MALEQEKQYVAVDANWLQAVMQIIRKRPFEEIEGIVIPTLQPGFFKQVQIGGKPDEE